MLESEPAESACAGDPAVQTIHGVLAVVRGAGVLLTGESGIGKSECALDLIRRGNRLVADDAVMLTRMPDGVEGRSPDLAFEYLEIRGLGIVNARELFGTSAVRRKARIDLCIEFKRPSEMDGVERIGADMRHCTILGTEMPKFVLPVTSGRNLATLVETAVRLFQLRLAGSNPAERFIAEHRAVLDETLRSESQ